MIPPRRLAIITPLTAGLIFGLAPTATADPTSPPTTPPAKVAPVPDVVGVEWPVQPIALAGQSVLGVDEMRFSTANLDGSASELDNGRTFVLTADVMFAYNKAKLTAKAKQVLNDIATTLTQAGDRQLSITGYTDSDGSQRYNLKLSKQRAAAVRAYLVPRLPVGTKITAAGRGESHPRASNKTRKGRSLNRRVEIVRPS